MSESATAGIGGQGVLQVTPTVTGNCPICGARYIKCDDGTKLDAEPVPAFQKDGTPVKATDGKVVARALVWVEHRCRRE